MTDKARAKVTWKSTSRKPKRARAESWVERLEPLAALREAFLPCHRAIVRAVFDEYLPSAGPVVELGAGLGQLCRWLEGWNSERFVHTEPDPQALAALSRAFPHARVKAAGASSLPFEDASCAAVVGVCVLDVVPDLDATLREARRVLVPGGVLVHFLDMAPRFETVLRELAAEDRIVLPNLFSDPSAQRWPEDLLLTERAGMQRLLAELDQRSHPLGRVFGHYFQNFARTPFDAAKAAREYEAFSRAPEMRELLKTLLASAYTHGFQLGVPAPRGVVASSGRWLADRFATAVDRNALTLELNDLRAAWASTPAAAEGWIYRSLALGHERRQQTLPEHCLCPAAESPTPGTTLVEAAMSVLVARRPG